MKAKEENSLFGGMAVPSWVEEKSSEDPKDKCSWLFKLDLQNEEF